MNEQSEEKIVLLVDDLATNLAVTGSFLRDKGFRVLVSTMGSNALQRAKQTSPDVILLDIMMEDMNGYEVCRHLKGDEQTKQIPVIMITALNDPKSQATAFEVGADDFINKPIVQPMLLQRIEHHLANAQKKKQNTESHHQAQRALNQQFIQSASDGDLVEVQSLLDQGADINFIDEEQRTALIWSAYYGHIEVAAFLIESGADQTIEDMEGFQAIDWAHLSYDYGYEYGKQIAEKMSTSS